MDEEIKEPVIKLHTNHNKNHTFLCALAKMHFTTPDKIEIKYDKIYKYYMINGIQIFREHVIDI